MQIQISLLLDRSHADTLTTQLASQLRDAIRRGRIAPGTRLPSSRRLSEQLGIGRNTVVRAYETLEIECYVESRPASGIFAAVLPADPRPAAGSAAGPPAASLAPRPRVPVAVLTTAPNPVRLSFDFAPGRTDPGLFPLKTWRRLLQTCLSHGGTHGLALPGDPFGLAALRAAIAAHLASARGIVAEPGQIIIVSGVREAIAITTRLFVPPGSRVCIEDPCFRPAAAAFQAAGAELQAIAVDEAGLRTDELPSSATALLYLTPAHQHPTGHTLSQWRRHRVAAWAQETGCLILEDDRGADFRFEGGAPEAIAAQAVDRTIHVGTFSQSLGGGLHLGYMVIPAALVDAVQAAKALLNGGSPWLDQAAVAEMISSGRYTSHVMRMRAAYRERRNHLLAALQRNFGDLDISGAAGGLHVFWQLPPGVPDAATVEALGRRSRVGVYAFGSGNVHQAGSSALSRRGLLLGYAALTPRQIDQGIARLSDAVDDALDGHTIGLSDLLVHRPLPSAPNSSLATQGLAQNRLARHRPVKPAPRFGQQPALSVAASDRAASGSTLQRGLGKPMAIVTGLYCYPIKGLSPQPQASVRLDAGKPFPFDRTFALARPGAPVTAEDPKWAKKGLFVMLMLDERLASVRTRLDQETLRLTVLAGDQRCESDVRRPLLLADLADPAGRRATETFFHRLAPTLPAPPTLVRSPDGHFMDKPDNVISLINLATLRSLGQQWGYTIDPLRFRANIYIDGVPPWAEFDWVGSDIRLGEAVFRVDRRNGRCGATNVDPATGQRDRDIPGSLRKAFGHKDLGIYLVARSNAVVAVGDLLERPADMPARTPATPAVAADGAFICRGCYYIYQEAQGLPQSGIVTGTRFVELPASWRCPDCGTDKANFQPHVPRV